MRPLALLILSATLLAGCTVPAAGPAPEDGSQAPPRTLPWGLEECTFVNWFVPVDAEALRPHLPEGFEAVAGANLPVPLPIAPERPYLGFEAFHCASGAGLSGDVADMEYGSIFTRVMPPEHLRKGGVEMYFVKWDTLVPDAERRAILAAAGLPARAGSASPAHLPQGAGASGQLTLEGLGTFGYEGGPALFSGDGGGEGGRFMEFTPAVGGLAVWDATYSLGEFAVGEGVLELPEGTWPAEVLGSERARGNYFAGRWTFHNATLTLPANERAGSAG